MTSKIFTKRRKFLLLWFLMILIAGTALRIQHISHTIDGHHNFRESHVASNIYFYVKNGLSIEGAMFAKNMTHEIFDFPLYQYIVTLTCSAFDLNIVVAGRLVNILIYLLTCIIILKLMLALKFRHQYIIIVLALFTFSPLTVFYHRAIIPDNLAILLAIQSLYHFVSWDIDRQHNTYHYWLMVLSGLLASLIKNPIYFPIVVTIISFLIFREKSLTGIIKPPIVFYLGLVAINVVLFKMYSNFLNVGSLRSPEWEIGWYFGSVADRLNVANYKTLIKRFSTIIVNPVFFLFCLPGTIFFIRRNLKKRKLIFLFLLFGNALTILVFLNVHVIHNYYQLPMVFIVAAFSGYFIYLLFLVAKKWKWKSKSILTRNGLSFSLSLFFGFGILVGFYKYALPTNEEKSLIAEGQCIKQNTREGNFIFYVAENPGWDPKYLFYAEREGYNVALMEANNNFIQEKIGEFSKNFKHFYLFSPSTDLSLIQKQLDPIQLTEITECEGRRLLKIMDAKPL